MTKDLCTDLEHSKLLAETGLMAGVEADGFHMHGDDPDEKGFVFDILWHTPKYRLDKILMKLKSVDLYRISECNVADYDLNFNKDFNHELLFATWRGDVNAAAKLLWLLWKEGLVK